MRETDSRISNTMQDKRCMNWHQMEYDEGLSVGVALAAYQSLHPAEQNHRDWVPGPGLGCSHFLSLMGNPSLRVKIKNGERIQILSLFPVERPQECAVGTVDLAHICSFPQNELI